MVFIISDQKSILREGKSGVSVARKIVIITFTLHVCSNLAITVSTYRLWDEELLVAVGHTAVG